MVENVTVPMQNRSKFLGIGGIHLKKLEMKTGVEISEESPGDFRIFAPNKQAMNEATQIIKEMLMNDKEPVLEFGGVYTATVVEIKEHGCMVILYPNMQPVLLHITQLDQRKVFLNCSCMSKKTMYTVYYLILFFITILLLLL